MKPRSTALPVLHAAFALTGIFQAIGGALLPALAASFGFADSRSGTLFLCYYLGTALGALFCAGRFARLIVIGFLADALLSIAIATSPPALFPVLFFALGVGVGIPMTAVSIYAGRLWIGRTAAPITLLNFTWSAGALLAPLLASRILAAHSWRAAYGLLALLAVLVAAACWLTLSEPPPEPTSEHNHAAGSNTARYALVALFAFLAFLQVGIENTTATWLASYSMRIAGTTAATAAAFSSLYWVGFLLSRGLSSLALLRANPTRVLVAAAAASLFASILLVNFPSAAPFAMALLGLTLAPIFPLLLSHFFARATHVSDSRWVLATCGFGGSFLPWLTGQISSATNSLRLGLWIVPAALVLMIAMLPLVRQGEQRSS